MEIKIFAEIEVPINERFLRIERVLITLGDEAISTIANAIVTQQTLAPDVCPSTADGLHLWRRDRNGKYCSACGKRQ